MTKRFKNVLMGVAALAALALGGSAIATAASGPGPSERSPAPADRGGSEAAQDDGREQGESDASEQVRGDGADRATAAALKSTGGGSANSVERDSENGATWEVEVTKPSGATVDVRLDDSYKVVVEEGDSEAPDETR